MGKNNCTVNIVAWQEGITPNLLSGFYEQFFINEGNESMRAIMQGLREDFENQKRVGAKEELEKAIMEINLAAYYFAFKHKEITTKEQLAYACTSLSYLKDIFEKRLKLLEEKELV